jgi:hypothetical protein
VKDEAKAHHSQIVDKCSKDQLAAGGNASEMCLKSHPTQAPKLSQDELRFRTPRTDICREEYASVGLRAWSSGGGISTGGND